MTVVRSEFDAFIDLTPGGHQRALERARGSHSSGSPSSHARRLLKDPTKQELRRIAAAAGVTRSISDSSEELRMLTRFPDVLRAFYRQGAVIIHESGIYAVGNAEDTLRRIRDECSKASQGPQGLK